MQPSAAASGQWCAESWLSMNVHLRHGGQRLACSTLRGCPRSPGPGRPAVHRHGARCRAVPLGCCVARKKPLRQKAPQDPQVLNRFRNTTRAIVQTRMHAHAPPALHAEKPPQPPIIKIAHARDSLQPAPSVHASSHTHAGPHTHTHTRQPWSANGTSFFDRVIQTKTPTHTCMYAPHSAAPSPQRARASRPRQQHPHQPAGGGGGPPGPNSCSVNPSTPAPA